MRAIGLVVAAIVIAVLALIPLLAASVVVGADPPPSEVWVDDDACPGPGSGTPADPYCKIQDGIDAVASPGTVHVADGYYVETIILKDGVAVLGAGVNVTTIDSGGGTVVIAHGVGADTVLDGFTIANGTALSAGGMYNDWSSPTVVNCNFIGNSALQHGGGMHNWQSSPTVTNCTFDGNSADWLGGGMYNGGMSSPTVTNCTFTENLSLIGGGGMHNEVSSPTVTNCIFNGNSADDAGGGMSNLVSSPTVTNCTFSGNSATIKGGGMFNDNQSSPTVTNCIFWDNGDEIWNEEPTPVASYCDIQGGYPGEGNIDADPLFVDPGGDDYHLQPGSPCIDAGSNAAVPPWLATDFEGDPRIADGDGDGDSVVDMGVDEVIPRAVGGTILPSDKSGLVMPWIVAGALILAAGLSLAVWNRKRGGERASGR